MLAPQLQEASTNSLGGILGVMYLLSLPMAPLFYINANITGALWLKDDAN